MSSRHTQLIHEGRYAAEIEYSFDYADSPWGPTVKDEDVQKADRVRLALRRGDVKAAAKEAKVFELKLLAGE